VGKKCKVQEKEIEKRAEKRTRSGCKKNEQTVRRFCKEMVQKNAKKTWKVQNT
jgi:hypothetical protein